MCMNYFRIICLIVIIWGTDTLIIYSQSNSIKIVTFTPTASNFTYPQSVFVDSPNGNIWITDFDNNRVLRFDVSTLTLLDELQSLNTPTIFFLRQNYPNPFNPSTIISWQSPVSSHQTLKVFDILGREIATLVDEYRASGMYDIKFDASKLSSGIYIYRIQIGSFVSSKKMIYLK